MLQKDVFEVYKGMFDLGEIDVWFANGYNSVRIRFVTKKELVFTYNGQNDWTLETLDSYITSMGKPRKRNRRNA